MKFNNFNITLIIFLYLNKKAQIVHSGCQGTNYVMQPAMLCITKYMWLTVYLFFTVFVPSIPRFLIQATYQYSVCIGGTRTTRSELTLYNRYSKTPTGCTFYFKKLYSSLKYF
jgi:hypothetical protein